MATEQSKTADSAGFIKCRVIAPTWGSYTQGAVVDATPREIAMTTHRTAAGVIMSRALCPLTEEEAEHKAKDKPDAAKHEREAQQRAQKRWAELGTIAERMQEERDTKRTRDLVEMLQGRIAAPAAPARPQSNPAR